MKKFLGYLFAVALLGTFTGVFASYGNNVLMAVGVFSLFWAGMLAPMLCD